MVAVPGLVLHDLVDVVIIVRPDAESTELPLALVID